MSKVAVIMSVYRSDDLFFFKQAVDSILNQTYRDLTLFIYRDGIVENKIHGFIKELILSDNRVIYIESSTNNGLAFALNHLIDIVIAESDYEFIARMDSDDISLPMRISKQVAFLLSHPNVHVCGTSCKEFGAEFALNEKHLPQNHSDLLDFSIIRCPFIHPSVMFRKSVFESGIRYPSNTSLTEDMGLWILLLKNGFIFHNINEILLDYRINNATMKRRYGFKKAISEFKSRFLFMIQLNRVTVPNVFGVFSRLIFHLLPASLMKLVYKYVR